jgi:hypothetical protein
VEYLVLGEVAALRLHLQLVVGLFDGLVLLPQLLDDAVELFELGGYLGKPTY